jgi:hypothetical protein
VSCPHSETLASEAKALAAAVLERLVPLLDGGSATPASCASCPVCAVLALLRGERPELAVTLAEHAAAVVAALRALLEEPVRPAGGEGTAGGAEGSGDDDAHGGAQSAHGRRRRVQRIPVTRA